MLVKCIYTEMKDVPQMPRVIETEDTNFGYLIKGEVFGVYGILVSRNRLDYLICRGNEFPFVTPSWFFSLLDNRIPSGWRIANTALCADWRYLYDRWGISLVAGYENIIDTYDHYDKLIDYDKEALNVFHENKRRMDIELYNKII